MLDRHWKRDCFRSDAGHPPLAFSSPLFASRCRDMTHFKWLFTCIKSRAKALNELLSTIQLEWPSHITQCSLQPRCNTGTSTKTKEQLLSQVLIKFCPDYRPELVLIGLQMGFKWNAINSYERLDSGSTRSAWLKRWSFLKWRQWSAAQQVFNRPESFLKLFLLKRTLVSGVALTHDITLVF